MSSVLLIIYKNFIIFFYTQFTSHLAVQHKDKKLNSAVTEARNHIRTDALLQQNSTEFSIDLSSFLSLFYKYTLYNSEIASTFF